MEKKKFSVFQRSFLIGVGVLCYLQRVTQLSKEWPSDPFGNNVESLFSSATIMFIVFVLFYFFNKLKKS